MNYQRNIIRALSPIFEHYKIAFSEKIYNQENNDYDLLMNVFGITPEMKRENRQYWGRELGMCWQLLVTEIFRIAREDFGGAIRIEQDEPCDFTIGELAIDTKYRIGSGDSGTLKKFKSYGPLLRDLGYEPVFLILRTDNLPSAIKACNVGTWNVIMGDDSFEFIYEYSGFDLREYFNQIAEDFSVDR